jgi:hypothetical protein
MILFNDSTVIFTEKRSEYCVKVLSIRYDTANLIFEFAGKGNGPDDFVMGVTNIQRDIHNSYEGIWVADIQSVKFYSYDNKLNSWRNISDIKMLPSKVIPSSHSFVTNSGLLCYSTAVDNQISISLSSANNGLTGYDFYPVNPNPYDKLFSKTIYSADIGIKPDKSKIALAYLFYKSVCIVSLDNPETPLFLKFKDEPFIHLSKNKEGYDTEAIRSLPLQYVDIYTTDSLIYVLYAGTTNDKLENHSQESMPDAMSIHIFKWDGTALCILNLDRIINCFCVDETNGIIYGIDPTVEENAVIYQFVIPELPKI